MSICNWIKVAQYKSSLELIRYSSKLRLRQPSAVAIGKFDGVHLGHQELLRLLKERSAARGLEPIVCTFAPLPEQFFSRPIVQLINLRTKVRLLACHLIEKVIVIHFHHSFSSMSAKEFINRFLIKQLKVAYLITGKDFQFGYDRQGKVDDLQLAKQKGYFDHEIMEDHIYQKQRISSSLIRQLLSQRQLNQAANYLGEPYTLYARISKGQGIGTTKLKTPTANLNLKNFFPCIRGVFACRAFLHNKAYSAVTNLGVRPTVNGSQPIVETHLLNFNQNILGEELKLQFIEYIREEKKFNSLEALARQIEQDKQDAFQLLNIS